LWQEAVPSILGLVGLVCLKCPRKPRTPAASVPIPPSTATELCGKHFQGPVSDLLLH
jgi:hypothetical protein